MKYKFRVYNLIDNSYEDFKRYPDACAAATNIPMFSDRIPDKETYLAMCRKVREGCYVRRPVEIPTYSRIEKLPMEVGEILF